MSANSSCQLLPGACGEAFWAAVAASAVLALLAGAAFVFAARAHVRGEPGAGGASSPDEPGPR